MSFTAKCNNCGKEQIFTTNEGRSEDKIEISLTEDTSSWNGSEVESIDISCNYGNCNEVNL